MKIRWGFDTGYVMRIPDFEIEIDDEDLEGLTEDEQDKIINEYVEQEFNNQVSFYWSRVE